MVSGLVVMLLGESLVSSLWFALQTMLMVSESESPGPEGAWLLHSQASLPFLLQVPLIHWMPVHLRLHVS